MKNSKGFSLVELSIVLVIIGLLIGGMVSGFAIYRENSLIQQARDDLKSIHDALTGFAIQQQRLPCPVDPAALNDGMEDPINGTGGCDVAVGFLPFRNLGVSGIAQDPWGNPYIYAVDGNFADDAPAFVVTDLGTLEIHDRFVPGNCNIPCLLVAQNVAAVFYSLGANGCTGFSIHEQENFDSGGRSCAAILNVPIPGPSGSNDQAFVSRQFSNTGPDRFDDQIMWIPSSILVNRMIQAGRLP